jgi:serine/threonine protein phosphatase 1
MPDREKFATLRAARRVWAVASVHGEADRLRALHGELAPRFEPGDRLVYLGNYLGRGAAVRATIDELLAFRLMLLAQPGAHVCDVAYLRGAQEEMWQKLLQLQFAPNPREVLDWMVKQGIGATLAAYGGHAEQGIAAARDGARALTRWTGELRAAMHAVPGHTRLMSALKRAAFTVDGSLLFVHAGIDTERPLTAQSDSFWWASGSFQRIDQPYSGFKMIVRGFDPAHAGLRQTAYTTSLDAGCGFGGALLAACLDLDGRIVERLEA